MAGPPPMAEEEKRAGRSGRRLEKEPWTTPGVGRRTRNDPRRRAAPSPWRRPPEPQNEWQGRTPGGGSRAPGPCGGSGQALEEPAGQDRRAKGPRGRPEAARSAGRSSNSPQSKSKAPTGPQGEARRRTRKNKSQSQGNRTIAQSHNRIFRYTKCPAETSGFLWGKGRTALCPLAGMGEGRSWDCLGHGY
jgi:hypothetical protein